MLKDIKVSGTGDKVTATAYCDLIDASTDKAKAVTYEAKGDLQTALSNLADTGCIVSGKDKQKFAELCAKITQEEKIKTGGDVNKIDPISDIPRPLPTYEDTDTYKK